MSDDAPNEDKKKKKPKRDESANLPGIYGQLGLQTTTQLIDELLVFAQKNMPDKVKKDLIRGSSKKEKLQSLERAVKHKFIEFERLVALLQDAEECGKQTITLLKPKNDALKRQVADGERFAELLFGEEWGEGYFPAFDRKKGEKKWADFRMGLPGRPNDWIAKLYSHEFRKKSQGKRERKEINKIQRIFREIWEYQLEEIDTTYVARWRHPDFLELRIDKTGSSGGKTDMSDRLGEFQESLAQAFDFGKDFLAFSLLPVIGNLLVCRNTHFNTNGKGDQGLPDKPIYQVGTAVVSSGKKSTVEFHPYGADKSIDDDPDLSALVNALVAKKGSAESLAIRWLPHDSDPRAPTEPLLTTLGGETYNELSVRSRVKPEVLEYVYEQLRKYSKMPS